MSAREVVGWNDRGTKLSIARTAGADLRAEKWMERPVEEWGASVRFDESHERWQRGGFDSLADAKLAAERYLAERSELTRLRAFAARAEDLRRDAENSLPTSGMGATMAKPLPAPVATLQRIVRELAMGGDGG